MVPRAGLEPARSFLRGILSPLCLPIPPPGHSFGIFYFSLNKLREKWRLRSESNRRRRICNPLHNHFATQPCVYSNCLNLLDQLFNIIFIIFKISIKAVKRGYGGQVKKNNSQNIEIISKIWGNNQEGQSCNL